MSTARQRIHGDGVPLTLGLTLGDPAGVGPEVIEAALASGQLDERWGCRIIGRVPSGTRPGRPTRTTAQAALDALEESVALLRSGEIDGVVTGPVSKDALAEVGFRHPGQTEFFAAAFAVRNFAMLLSGPHLTVGLVTCHVPLASAIRQLKTREIVRVGRLMHRFFLERGRPAPRLAVAGLNPHAGENGLLGREEIEIVAPAVEQLRAEFADGFHGPVSPDAVFREAARGAFDGVLCLYHDQALIPLKLIDFDSAVNVTLGLPIVRTSPAHGTAFDIAGQGSARPASLIAAISLAAEMVLARRRNTAPAR